MTTTYRAAYFYPATGNNGAGVVLTSEDQAGLSDAELRTAARAVALGTGLIGTDDHQVSEEAFEDGLHIGMLTE